MCLPISATTACPNPSSISINMKNISLSDDSDPAFEIMAQPESVSPRSTETIQVKVRPMLPTTIEATLIVESNADQDPLLEARIKVTSRTNSLIMRAFDSSGGFMPQRVPWNAKGYLQNSWYRLPITVS